MESRSIPARLGLVIALIFTAAVYWPGLYGGFLFDDYPNIVDNHALQIKTVSIPDLAGAALSSPSSEFKRPLASLSFAANYLLTGLDPYWMKLTNLVIHLINGVLVYALALALIFVAQRNTSGPEDRDPRWIALLIATGWMLLPINLTGVLYVVQRMESLANVFVLLGLIGYVAARRRMLDGRRGLAAAAASLVLATAVGLLAKETAVMTPLYAALIEWSLFRARKADGHRDAGILGLFIIVLVIPLIVGLTWELPHVLNAGAWETRDFTLPQRLLSEARIVADYIRWTLLPTPHALSFYHDDYRVSTGWLTPWTTLPCVLILAGLAVLVAGLRKRAPLVALGLALFFGAQLLTATVLPLELVYEHRNYFPSFGLLLALVPLLAATAQRLPMPVARGVLLGGLMLLWTAETAATAYAWGQPLRLARTLAERAPQSPRAQYALGRTDIILSDYDPKSPFTVAAYAPLERAMRLPNASILPEQALIMMNSRMHLPLKNAWWNSMIAKLKAHKPGVQDQSSLSSLTKCAINKDCDLPEQRMVDAFLAALSHPNPNARLLASYGDYAWNVMHDNALAMRLARGAVKAAPHVAAYHITLARMLIAQGQPAAAQQQIKQLQAQNIGGHLDGSIAELRKKLSTPPQPASR